MAWENRRKCHITGRKSAEREKQTWREHGEQSREAKHERLCTFPALINKVWLGLGSAHCSSSSVEASHTHARICAVCHHSCIDWHGLTPFNCPWAEAVAKAESIISVVKVRLCTQLQTVSILSFFNIMDFLFFIKVCRQKRMHVPASQKNLTNNKIMRSYKYSSHWPEQGGVLIEMMLSCSSLRTFTQTHTQVLSAYNGSIRLLCDGAPITNCI